MFKVHYPAQYSADGKTVYEYTIDSTLAEVQNRVSGDLSLVHGLINTGSYNQRPFKLAQGFDPATSVSVNQLVVDLHLNAVAAKTHFGSQIFLHSIVEIWAQRARITGLRGDRFYALTSNLSDTESDCFQVLDPSTYLPISNAQRDELNDYRAMGEPTPIILRAEVLLGSMIFYNAQRATAGFGDNMLDIAQDMDSLVAHLVEAEPSISLDITSKHGTISYGR